MPTTRRQSQGVPSSGPSTPSALLTPVRRTTRSASHTPSAAPSASPAPSSAGHGHEHHKTVDELAIEEAARLLDTKSLSTPRRMTRSQSVAPVSEPRSTRSTRGTPAAAAASPAITTPSKKSQGRLGSPSVEIRKAKNAARARSTLSIAMTVSDAEDEDSVDGDEADADAADEASADARQDVKDVEDDKEQDEVYSQASTATHTSSAALTTGTSSAFVDGMIGSALHSAVPSDGSAPSEDGDRGDAGSAMSGTSGAEDGSTAAEEEEEEEEEEEDDASTARAESPLNTPQQRELDLQTSGDEEVSGSTSESEHESDSDVSDSESASSSEDGSDEEEEESDDEDLDRLLAAARRSAQRKADSATSASASVDASGGGLVGFGDESILALEKEDTVKDAPIPRMSIPSLTNPSLTFGRPAQAGPSRPRASVHSKNDPAPSDARAAANASKYGALPVVPEGVEMDTRPYERTMSKREKAAQPKKATTSELWSTMPSTRADLLPQMKRDYQALALANSLDPKRFMKGGSKANKVPEHFAIGTVIEQSRKLQSTTLQKEKSYRPGQLVQGIAADEGVGSYAKRKFGDLQYGRMENGRGKGWKKRSKWCVP